MGFEINLFLNLSKELYNILNGNLVAFFFRDSWKGIHEKVQRSQISAWYIVRSSKKLDFGKSSKKVKNWLNSWSINQEPRQNNGCPRKEGKWKKNPGLWTWVYRRAAPKSWWRRCVRWDGFRRSSGHENLLYRPTANENNYTNDLIYHSFYRHEIFLQTRRSVYDIHVCQTVFHSRKMKLK